MKKYLLIAVGAAALVRAVAAPVLWPEQMAEYKKVASAPLAIEDRPLWEEYGLLQAEQAEYAAPGRTVKITAWRMNDPTGAFAAFQLVRPANAKASDLAEASAETSDGVLFVFGNYLIRIDGWKSPKLDHVGFLQFLQHLPAQDHSPLPSVYLPGRGLVPNSERYVLGPAGLERFEKGVAPAVAAFSMGAEAQIGEYNTAAGPMKLAIFSYPSPQIARQRLEEFSKLGMAKRAGPLVAVLLAPKDANEGEKLLAAVRYNAVVTEHQRVPTRRDNVGDLLLNIFLLVGIILAVIIPAGVLVGLLRRFGWGSRGEAMTVLHLEDRSGT